MKRKFLKYFIMCTAIMMFMSSRIFATTYSIPVWSNQNNNVIENSINTNTTNNITVQDSSNNITNNTITNEVSTSNTINNEVLDSNVVKTNANVSNIETISDNPLKLTCGGAVLIEQNSGTVLYDYNMHEQLRPASVTKVMTILLIMEAIDEGRISLTDKVSCSNIASSMGGSQIWLDTREQLTVDEMLKAICVVSANDYDVQK